LLREKSTVSNLEADKRQEPSGMKRTTKSHTRTAGREFLLAGRKKSQAEIGDQTS
jgi:hypothetical protein